MNLEEAIHNPAINAFDIINNEDGTFKVVTYRKDGEDFDNYLKRHQKNWAKAKQLKSKNPA